MTSPHVMLDLEALGNGNDAVILSIGACKFDETEIIDKFHVAIEPESCVRCGLKMDAGTVMWWLDHDRQAAREALLSYDRIDLHSALYGLSDWLGECGPIWGNGSTFDNVILRSAYRVTALEYPVKFWMDRCYRTVKNLAPLVTIEREGTHHDALDDAVSQARHLQKLVAHLGCGLS